MREGTFADGVEAAAKLCEREALKLIVGSEPGSELGRVLADLYRSMAFQIRALVVVDSRDSRPRRPEGSGG